ncbi:MAG: glycosyl transferase family 2, partial [Acetatifactor sp.]|nr:glycosyl transferase family 2 [Acetatifactor sp.]
EIEYRFAELYYVNTLFSYMAGVEHPKLSFVRELRAGIRERFPLFERNAYYRKYTGREEQQLIALQQKWNLGFYLLYRLKLFVRKRAKGM